MHSRCAECRKAIQKICQNCSTLTRKQFHDQCYKQKVILNKEGYVLETVQKKPSRKRYLQYSIAISVGIAGIILLGFTTNMYAEVFQNQPSNTEMMKHDDIPVPQVRHTLTAYELQNCLAYGSGESVTVTCPTQYGYVYKAILDMPKDLATKFSDSVFSIRAVSLATNSDGTVILQYENNDYLTSFFAS